MELDEVKAYAPDWRVAWASRTQRWVATRIGGLTLATGDQRRYALFAYDLDDLVTQIDRQRGIDREDATPMTISSWSSAYVPNGTPVRHQLDETGEIRLVLGDADQLEISMPPQVAQAITRTLRAALTGQLA